MSEILLGYGAGIVSGLSVAWVLFSHRVKASPSVVQLRHRSIAQVAFISCVMMVCDEATFEEITQETNELLDEYDILGDPKYVFDPPESGE